MRGYPIIVTALALAITPAMAGGKGSGGHASTNQNHLQESVTLNYGKVRQTYKQQSATVRDISTGQASGKRHHHPISISH
jgi:hypothetical protein